MPENVPWIFKLLFHVLYELIVALRLNYLFSKNSCLFGDHNYPESGNTTVLHFKRKEIPACPLTNLNSSDFSVALSKMVGIRCAFLEDVEEPSF